MSAPVRTSPAAFVKLSADVACSYGFRPAREYLGGRGAHTFPTVSHACVNSFATHPQEPILAFYATGAPSHVPAGLSPREVGEVGLLCAGAQESVGEIVLLKTAAAILTEWGAKISRVRVNALGDKDSKLRFSRELSLYLRKHANSLHPTCRDMLSQNPYGAFVCATGICREMLEDGPRSMNFLSEKSRAHFREMLEHLENLGLPYELDDLLVGDDREPRVLFAIDLENEDATVIASFGGRYDDYVRKITNRKEGSAVHASLYFRKKGLSAESFRLRAPQRQAKIYFVQLGLRAKLQGLVVLDVLRAARIPVLQSFDASKLGHQMQAAARSGVSHLIIMGQREALDHTVIVRAVDNSAQTTVGLLQLPKFLKSLK